jgi:hypothetical protein
MLIPFKSARHRAQGAALWAALACLCHSAEPVFDLAEGFVRPPDAARPWVYWFPLDGNITSNGITLDLEAMKRVGIGGVLYMETDQGAPRGPAKFAGPLWRNLFQHICAEANRLGLQVNVNNDAGWCGSGGPWITPELSMQRVVWTETNVTGPLEFGAVLPQAKATANFYRDIAVFAFPTPVGNYVIQHLRGKSAEVRQEIPARATFPVLPADVVVPRDQLVNLTTKLRQDGRFAWDVPAGKWTLLRLGHTSTGQENHPAPVDGRGLECDKFSKQAVEVMFNGLMGKLIADSKPFVGESRTLVSTHIDSWEVGSQNWTPRFRDEFKRRRGYDPQPLLPVMSGRVVDSLEISERFLWDVRRTVSDLIAEVYAGHFRTLARRHGIRLSIEAYDGSPTDDLMYAGRADEPMGEFWSWAKFGAADSCTEMASAAHVYGKRILGAEAFTAADGEKWLGHPANIKDLGDWAFCEGVNRFVFHRYALQPWDDVRPGMSMGPWGLHYERTQTWWEQSKAWHEYLARCQFLLQQGLFVADLCFLAPETSPQRFKSPVKSGHDRPGYNFDGCPPEIVLTRMKVLADGHKDGRLVLPDGMSYRMLVLPQTPTMTPELLRKIRDLVQAGATVLGAPPLKSPSLRDYPKCDEEVKALARELWGDGQAPAELTERPFGKGRVIWGREVQISDEPSSKATSSLGAAKWIWFNEGNPAQAAPPGRRYFRRVLTLDAGSEVESVRLVMTADNSFECWVNGQRVGAGDNFQRSYGLSVTSALKPGANLIAVLAVNGADTPNPAGLIGALTIQLRDGRTLVIPTDASWEAAKTVSGQWNAEAAGTGSWSAAKELGPFGMAPWGDIGETPPDPILDVNIACRVLEKMGVPADFSCRTKHAPQSLRYIHKRINATDVYFVANKNPQAEEALCSFRVQGRRPQLWWPDTGRIERPAVYEEADGCTRLPIRFEPSGSVFVIFRDGDKPESDRISSVSRNGETILSVAWPKEEERAQNLNAAPVELTRDAHGRVNALVWQSGRYLLQDANGKRREVNVTAIPEPLELSGPWEVHFEPRWGGPESVTFERLEDWSKRPEDGIRYYSGTAIYRRTFTWAPGQSQISNCKAQIFLDLGKVAVIAEVTLNGKGLGILWKPPFRVEVTDAVTAGENLLELRVVNLWVNRQIGDEQLPEDSERNPNGTLKRWPQWLNEGKPSPTGRYTFTSWRLWKKDSPLQESGLLGPVRLVEARSVEVPE